MSRFIPYFGIVAALLTGIVVLSVVRSIPDQSPAVAPVTESPPLVPVASSSSAAPSEILLPPEKKAAPVSKPTSLESDKLSVSATKLVGALVNILCYAPERSGFKSISASGVIVDPKGIILTNAHVAAYFLLADRGVSCTIRSGSPATDKYVAAPIYIPPPWLRANADILTNDSPSGTGEYDFAFLAIHKSATSAPLPSTFPFIPLGTIPLLPGSTAIIASYGAQALESKQILSALLPTFVYGAVKKVFTFKTDTIDVLALGGSIAAKEGSSGGGVAGASGNLAGIITTSTIEGDTSTRSLDAITTFYIRREFANETGGNLDTLLAEPTAVAIESFATQIPTLEAIITAHLP